MSVSYLEYKKYRKENSWASAQCAVQSIRSRKANADKWGDVEFYSNSITNFKHEGYHISVEIAADEWCDHDWEGDFSHLWTPGAIINPDWGRASEYQRHMGACQYFIPANPWKEAWKYCREVSKLGRHEAYTRAIREALESCAAYGKHSIYVVTVKAYKEGVLLGWDSLSGVEFNDRGCDDPYLYELLNDMVPGAIDSAGAVLKKLCEV